MAWSHGFDFHQAHAPGFQRQPRDLFVWRTTPDSSTAKTNLPGRMDGTSLSPVVTIQYRIVESLLRFLRVLSFHLSASDHPLLSIIRLPSWVPLSASNEGKTLDHLIFGKYPVSSFTHCFVLSLVEYFNPGYSRPNQLLQFLVRLKISIIFFFFGNIHGRNRRIHSINFTLDCTVKKAYVRSKKRVSRKQK